MLVDLSRLFEFAAFIFTPSRFAPFGFTLFGFTPSRFALFGLISLKTVHF